MGHDKGSLSYVYWELKWRVVLAIEMLRWWGTIKPFVRQEKVLIRNMGNMFKTSLTICLWETEMTISLN